MELEREKDTEERLTLVGPTSRASVTKRDASRVDPFCLLLLLLGTICREASPSLIASFGKIYEPLVH